MKRVSLGKALRLRAKGYTYEAIGERFGVSKQAVEQMIKNATDSEWHTKLRARINDQRRKQRRALGAATYHCSLCGAASHNAKTCPNNKIDNSSIGK